MVVKEFKVYVQKGKETDLFEQPLEKLYSRSENVGAVLWRLFSSIRTKFFKMGHLKKSYRRAPSEAVTR